MPHTRSGHQFLALPSHQHRFCSSSFPSQCFRLLCTQIRHSNRLHNICSLFGDGRSSCCQEKQSALHAATLLFSNQFLLRELSSHLLRSHVAVSLQIVPWRFHCLIWTVMYLHARREREGVRVCALCVSSFCCGGGGPWCRNALQQGPVFPLEDTRGQRSAKRRTLRNQPMIWWRGADSVTSAWRPLRPPCLTHISLFRTLVQAQMKYPSREYLCRINSR